MITKESTTEYFIPSTRKQWGYIYKIMLPKIAESFGVQDRKMAHQRMKDRLIELRWIKESRKELDYFQVNKLIRVYKNYLIERGVCIE